MTKSRRQNFASFSKCALAVILVLNLGACSLGGEADPSSSSAAPPKSKGSSGTDGGGPVPQARGRGEQTLGSPLRATVVWQGAYTKRSDGTPLTVLLAPGIPAELSVLDSRNGELLDSQTISGGADALVKNRAISSSSDPDDRKIYLGLADGRGVSYDPDTRSVRDMPTAPGMHGEMFWGAEPMDDGTITFSSYPSAKLLSYDPIHRTWKDFGSFGAGNKYTLEMAGRGDTTFVGTGTKSPEIWSVNRKTGQRKRIALPPANDERKRDFAFNLQVVGNYLYVRVDGENRIYSLDLTSRKWTGEIGDAARGLAGSGHGDPEGLYWLGLDGKMRFRPNGSSTDTVLPRDDVMGAIRGYTWQDLDGDGDSESLLTVTSGASIQSWNSETRESKTIASQALGAPSLIRSLGVSPDGSVLAGAYGTAPYFAALPVGGRSYEEVHLRGQVESFGTSGKTLLAGTYPSARVHVTTTNGVPEQEQLPTWSIGHGQDRPLAMEDLGDGKVAVATMPKFGRTGGAVSIIRPNVGIEKTLDEITPGKTPVALAHRGNVLYVGSGATGGLGSELASGGAQVLAVNTITGRTAISSTPIPGDATISALMFDAQGTLWGWSVDSVFSLDPGTLKVLKIKKFSNAVDDEPYARGRELVDGGAQLFGSARGKIFSIDKTTLKRKNLAEGANLVRGGDGFLYYSRGSTLFRWLSAGS